LDNYDEVTKNLSIDQKSSLVAKTDEKLSEYIMSSNGIIRKLERDRYLAVFEQRSLDEFIENKFSVLSAVREIENPDGMAVTLSFGIGKDASSFRENFDHALLALDMALSRGGDQAVIKNSTSFEYYGGHSKETEKRTKVKSRVTASALSQLMLTSSNVIVMGHAVSDMDSVGASIGICAIARFYGKTAYIATDINASSAYSLIRRMQATDEYANTFISRESAMLMADEDSLLVVVDTNRPEQTECPELLTKCSKIAVVDHHRRASSYIDNATVNFHESYASSASELVAELLQYTMEPSSLSKLESEALLAGITLDTKSFTSKTGVRTFEAAAFLRRCGSDTIEIKKLFQSDLSSELEKYGVMGNAKKLDEDIIIAVSEVEVSRVTASKVADEMLNISGVEASFVLFPLGDSFIISARSLGKINVQIILETLGGGGHLTMAGAQIQAPNVEDAKDMLVAAINTYKKSL